MAATLHTCAAPSAVGYYSSCDRNGCGRKTYANLGAAAYGPGTGYTINTLQTVSSRRRHAREPSGHRWRRLNIVLPSTLPLRVQFTVSTSFPVDASGKLTAVTTTVSQGSNTITLRHDDTTCSPGYVAAMTTYLAKGMVPVVSLWGGDMSWLDSPPCSGTPCSSTATATFSNFQLNTIAAPSASATPTKTPPPPSPSGTPTPSWSTGALPSPSNSQSNAPQQSGTWAAARCAGSLSLTVDGQVQSWAVAQQSWMHATASGAAVTVTSGDRAYLVKACAAQFSATMYTAGRFNLLGKSFSYTASLANAGCGCSANLAFLQMPGYDSTGHMTASGLGDGYCE